jgi:putative serine protease PepD
MWLQVRTGPDAGTAVELPGDRPFVLGRQQGSDLVVRDARASRRHVELAPAGERVVVLRDLGSANGTVVDGVRVEEARLEGGEEIRIGDVVIAVTPGPPSPPQAERAVAGEDDLTPELATPSMVRRLVDQGTRRARRAALAAAALAVVVVVAVVLLVGGSGEQDVPEVVEALTPSTVLVLTERAGQPTGQGSGWVLDAGDGLVVTNAHVVNQGTAFRVAASGRAATRPGRVVASSPCEDLALLRVDGLDGLQAAPPAAGDSIQQGESVVALGFANGAQAGDGLGSTTGVVSQARTAFRDPSPDVPAYPEVVQTDTALNPGNSGGPLADREGRVIGVNSAARSTGEDGRALQNVNYAIRIDRARRVLDEMRAGRTEAWTGFTFGYPTDQELVDAGLPGGVRVTGAIPGTPAARSGVESGGLLAGVDGQPLENTLESYCEAMRGRGTGDEVVLGVIAPGETEPRAVRLTLG